MRCRRTYVLKWYSIKNISNMFMKSILKKFDDFTVYSSFFKVKIWYIFNVDCREKGIDD